MIFRESLCQTVLLRAILGLIALCFLSGCAVHYLVEEDSVYFVHWNEGVGKSKLPVIGADAATFEHLTPPIYGKDKHAVYYHGELIEEADPEGFAPISKFYSRNREAVFWFRLRVTGADPKTFVPLTGDWGRDAQDYYFKAHALMVTDHGASEFVPGYKQKWVRDGHHYFYENHRIPSEDYAGFQVLHVTGYGKDTERVYFADRVLEGADAASFAMVGNTEIGMDKNGFYAYGRPTQPSEVFLRKHGLLEE